MEERSAPLFKPIATITSKISPWLGWEVLFDNLNPAEISNVTPLVENCLSAYLQSNLDVSSKKFVLPIKCRLEASGGNPQLYVVKVAVFKRFLFFRIPFSYSEGPIVSIDGFRLVEGAHGGGDLVAVALRPGSRGGVKGFQRGSAG